MLDGLTLFSIRKELSDIFTGAKIIDIFQTKKYKIVIEVMPKKLLILPFSNKDKKTFFIHISIDPSLLEIYFSKYQNNKNTINTPFLTLLQNHLKGGKILNIKQIDFDRILHFTIQPYIKFGKALNKTLIVEFTGKHSNLILLKGDNTIEGSLKLITSDINRYREVVPGKLYISPPSQNKLNPLKINQNNFLDLFYSVSPENKSLHLWELIQNNFMGMSQQSAKEIILQANLSPEINLNNISKTDLEILWSSFIDIIENIKKYNFQPTIFLKPQSKKIKIWSIIDSVQFPDYNKHTFDNTNSCLETLFTELDKEKIIFSLKNKLHQVINKNIAKIDNKVSGFQKKLDEVKNCEKYKKNGELIKANLASIKRWDTKITTINYFSPKQEITTIPLNKKYTPLQNAQLYFKKYKKTKDSYNIILKQLEDNKSKLDKLYELQTLYKRNDNSLSELTKINYSLIKLGYIKKKEKKEKKKRKDILSPSKYVSKNGWDIYVGKNNKQNDFLTLKLASGNDIWLHVKNIQGSHVIIKNKGNNRTPPLETLIQAANLAVYFSKAKNENKAQVDYTLKKYVKKPKNAKPGMVIYSQEKSLLVKLDMEIIKNIFS